MAVLWAHEAGLRVVNGMGCQGLAYPQACRAIADYLASYGWLVPVTPADSTHVGDVFAQTLAEMARSAPPHALAAAAAAGQWDPMSVWGRPPPVVPPSQPAAQGAALGGPGSSRARLRPGTHVGGATRARSRGRPI